MPSPRTLPLVLGCLLGGCGDADGPPDGDLGVLPPVDLLSGEPDLRNRNTGEVYPDPPREMRGIWVATVSNIDWPSAKGLAPARQEAEALAILEMAKELHLTSVFLQVRPSCDAVYPSTLEPWTEFLNGPGDRAPSPSYDPLQFWVDEAHKRGLQLHAWFNPYRAALPSMTVLPERHIVKRRPDLARPYGKYYWLDPGEPEVQAYTTSVIVDVAFRYEIDGVHFDDYFYPYRSYGDGADFPDEPSYTRYKEGGGTLPRADFRRESVNQLIRNVQSQLKIVRPDVLFGIAPFGIWRPGYPAGIKGLDAYADLYADSRKWLNQGWVDYLAPQLYWPIAQTAQSYTSLLDWWIGENRHGVHLFAGHNLSLGPVEMLAQISENRKRMGAHGSLFFGGRGLLNNEKGNRAALSMNAYAAPALPPRSPWLPAPREPAPPLVTVVERSPEAVTLNITSGDPRILLHVIYYRDEGGPSHRIVPASEGVQVVKGQGGIRSMALSGVDRQGNESVRVPVEL